MNIEEQKAYLDKLLTDYASFVKQGLLSCSITQELDVLREKTKDACWIIASGGDQNELREVFRKRGIASLFDGGIFGSPDDKYLILQREIDRIKPQGPILFLGDSKYDYEVAKHNDIDFIFIHQWTEVKGWAQWVEQEQIKSASEVRDIITFETSM